MPRCVVIGLGILLLAGCSPDRAPSGDDGGSPSRGQGPPRLRLVPVGRFERPVQAIGVPAAGSTIVVEQAGRVLLVEGMQCRGSSACPDAPKVRGRTIIDLSDAVSSGAEQGLLGFAFHPSWPTVARAYVNYTDRSGDTRIQEWILERSLGRARLGRELLRIDQPYDNHNGGGLAFGPDGLLYVGTGDGGAAGDPEQRAQDPASLLGKLLRLDVEQERPEPEVWAVGLRNPWRYSFDRSTGDLWIGDVGQQRFEEVDAVARAQLSSLRQVNFGWSLREGYAGYVRSRQAGPGTPIEPVLDYPHDDGCSVTGGVVYRGARLPDLRGWYLFGDLCARELRLVDARGVPGSRRGRGELSWRRGPIAEQVVHVGETADGELLVVSHMGEIFEVVPA